MRQDFTVIVSILQLIFHNVQLELGDPIQRPDKSHEILESFLPWELDPFQRQFPDIPLIPLELVDLDLIQFQGSQIALLEEDLLINWPFCKLDIHQLEVAQGIHRIESIPDDFQPQNADQLEGSQLGKFALFWIDLFVLQACGELADRDVVDGQFIDIVDELKEIQDWLLVGQGFGDRQLRDPGSHRLKSISHN